MGLVCIRLGTTGPGPVKLVWLAHSEVDGVGICHWKLHAFSSGGPSALCGIFALASEIWALMKTVVSQIQGC